MQNKFLKLLSLLLLLANQGISQGLLAERSFNEGYLQTPQQILVTGTHTFLVYQTAYSDAYITPSVVVKLDPEGNILSETLINPVFGERIEIEELIPTEDGGFYMAGTTYLLCDVPEPTPFIQKYDALGNVVWTTAIPDSEDIKFLSGFSLIQRPDVSKKLMFSLSNSDDWFAIGSIYAMNTDGEIEDTIAVATNQFEHFEQLDETHIIASKDDSLFTYNFDGEEISVREFNQPIREIAAMGDTLIVLSEDSLSYLNTALVNINAISLAASLAHKDMVLYETELLVHGATETQQYVYSLGYDLSITASLIIPIELDEDDVTGFTKTQFSTGITFDLYKYDAVRYLNYSLLTTDTIALNRTDAGIIDIRINDKIYNEIDQVNLSTEVLLKNHGTEVLNSCIINHYRQNGVACGASVYQGLVTGLNLLPGESIWLDLGFTGFKYIDSPFEGPIFNYCFYTSNPNELCDLNVDNDSYCRDLTDQLSTTAELITPLEIYPNPFEGSFFVQNLPTGYATFKMYDLVGNVVLEGSLTDTQINAAQLPSGTYLLQVLGPNLNTFNQLIVKN